MTVKNDAPREYDVDAQWKLHARCILTLGELLQNDDGIDVDSEVKGIVSSILRSSPRWKSAVRDDLSYASELTIATYLPSSETESVPMKLRETILDHAVPLAVVSRLVVDKIKSREIKDEPELTDFLRAHIHVVRIQCIEDRTLTAKRLRSKMPNYWPEDGSGNILARYEEAGVTLAKRT